MKLRWKTFLAWISAILGLVSCEKGGIFGGGIGGAVCMYGMPTTDYDMTITITDEDGKPIKGIEVSPDHESEQKAHSDDKGIVEMKVQGVLTPYVILSDVDGVENGGEFEELELKGNDFTLKQVKKGDGSWYQGEYKAVANATMKKKVSDK